MKVGYVALVGRPNVGKSTLMNHLLGQKISITSRKPQTTRHRILGINTCEKGQAIYMDTPGMHQNEKKALNRYLNQTADNTLFGVDVVVWLIDGLAWQPYDDVIFKKLKLANLPVILVVNKVDRVQNKEDIFKFLGKKLVQDDAVDFTALKNYIPSNIPEKDTVVDIFGGVQLQTDPINFKPSSQEINAIQWLSSGQSLMVGTLGAEYIVSGDGTALSATSINYRRQTSRGGNPVMPVRIDDEVMYILRDGRKVNNFRYNRNNGSFLSGDITSHADHIVDVGDEATVAQFVQLEYCTSRDLLLAITDDNYLLGFTYSPQNNTMSWLWLVMV